MASTKVTPAMRAAAQMRMTNVAEGLMPAGKFPLTKKKKSPKNFPIGVVDTDKDGK